MNLLLFLLLSELPFSAPAVKMSEQLRWSPDQPKLLWSAFPLEGSCQVRALYLTQENGTSLVQAFEETNEYLGEPICRNINHFGWGDNGTFFYISRELTNSRAELVLVQHEETHKELKRFKLPEKVTRDILSPQLILNNQFLLFSMVTTNGNGLFIADLSKEEFKEQALELSPKFDFILGLSHRWIDDQLHVLFSGQLENQNIYKTYGFTISSANELKTVIQPSRLTSSVYNLAELYPKLSPDGKHIVFYGSDGKNDYSGLYGAAYGGETSRWDELRFGEQQGLLASAEESAYAWSPDGYYVFYLLRNDPHNNPIVYRQPKKSKSLGETIIPSEKLSQKLDISPVTGQIAYVTFESDQKSYAQLRISNLKTFMGLAPSYPKIEIKVPSNLEASQFILKGEDAPFYDQNLKEGLLSLTPKPNTTLKQGLLRLVLNLNQKNIPLKSVFQTHYDFSQLFAEKELHIENHFFKPSYDAEKRTLVFERQAIEPQHIKDILDLPETPTYQNHQFIIKLPASIETVNIGESDLPFHVVHPITKVPVSVPHPLSTSQNKLKAYPKSRELSIFIRKTSPEIERTMKHLTKTYAEKFSSFQRRSHNKLDFSFLDDPETTNQIIKALFTAIEETNQTLHLDKFTELKDKGKWLLYFNIKAKDQQ